MNTKCIVSLTVVIMFTGVLCRGAASENHIDAAFKDAINKNDRKAVRLLMECGANTHNLSLDEEKKLIDLSVATVHVLPSAAQCRKASQIFNSAVSPEAANKNLLLAAQAGNVDQVTEALQNGANINTKNENNCTALVLALFYRHNKIADQLITLGADVNLIDALGRSALTIAVKLNADEMVARLIEVGVNVNVTDAIGLPALASAARNNNEPIVTRLIKAKADLNAADKVGFTALMFAARINNGTMVNQLAEAGANVDAVDSEDMTALMVAAVSKSAQAAEALLNKGANISLTNNDNQTALDISRQRQNNPVTPMLENWEPMGG